MTGVLESDAPARVDGPPPRRRRWPVHVLTVLGALVLLVTATNVWVKRQVLDTDHWVTTSQELLAHEDVRDALSAYLVDQLDQAVDLPAQLRDRLPDELEALAAPLAANLRQAAVQAVDRLVASPRFADLWASANRVAHQALVNVLKDETRPGTSTAGGTVTIELRELLVQLADRLGLPGTLVEKIPEGAGTITVVHSDDLSTAQDVVTIVDKAAPVLFLVSAALFGAAIWLAGGWRRVAIRNVGAAIVVVGAAILAMQRWGRSWAVDHLVADPANRPLVGSVLSISTDLLRTIAWSVLAFGAVVLVATAFVGPARWARSLRRSVGPSIARNPAALWIGALTVVLLLVAWTPFDLFETAWGVLAVALVAIAGIEAFRQVCVREHAAGVDAGTPA